MRPRFHRDARPRQATEYLLDGFRCDRQFVLRNDFSCFIQNAVRTGAVSQIQPNAQLSFENAFPLACIVLIFCIAGLLSLCFEHVRHWELNASRGRPAFSLPSDKRRSRYLAYASKPNGYGKLATNSVGQQRLYGFR
jgi:hypothetical protein